MTEKSLIRGQCSKKEQIERVIDRNVKSQWPKNPATLSANAPKMSEMQDKSVTEKSADANISVRNGCKI